MYADVSCNADALALQSDLDRIEAWCFQWRMSLNISKCVYIRFTRKTNFFPSSYTIGGLPLILLNETKYLGVIFSSNLSWNKHVDHITAKASRSLGFIKRNFRLASSSLKETLYFSLVRSVLDYACTIWDPYRFNLEEQIEKIQNRAARFVTGNYDFRTSVTELKSSLDWRPLRHRRQCLRLKLLHNIFHNNTGICKSTHLLEPAYVSLRVDNSKKIRPYKCRTDVFKFSFFPRSVEDWNKLPNDIVETLLPELFFEKIQSIV